MSWKSFPQARRVRVRGVQVHGKAVEQAAAGQRTALNLASVTTQELARGMVLARPSTFQPASRIDVSLSLLPSAKPLKDRARVHLHAYTFEAIATVSLFGKRQLSPGETAFARLRLAEPTLLLPGDRFIMRQFSPVVTIGGGVVLDASPIHRMPRPGEFSKNSSRSWRAAILSPSCRRVSRGEVMKGLLCRN